MESVAPDCAVYQNTPDVQAAWKSLVQAGKDLESKEDKVNQTRTELETDESDLAKAVSSYDSAYDHYAATVERYATSASDVTGLGMGLLGKNEYTLAPPLSVDVSYDVIKGLIRISVRKAAGMRAIRIEISPDPITPTSWKELPGNGARAALSGYAPGTYWVRAASVVAGDRSEFTTPVAVIVK